MLIYEIGKNCPTFFSNVFTGKSTFRFIDFKLEPKSKIPDLLKKKNKIKNCQAIELMADETKSWKQAAEISFLFGSLNLALGLTEIWINGA